MPRRSAFAFIPITFITMASVLTRHSHAATFLVCVRSMYPPRSYRAPYNLTAVSLPSLVTIISEQIKNNNQPINILLLAFYEHACLDSSYSSTSSLSTLKVVSVCVCVCVGGWVGGGGGECVCVCVCVCVYVSARAHVCVSGVGREQP